MGRKILFVTTDQQRYDTLGCNGGTLARTPVVDGLAAAGVRYERAQPQSVVCMPSRSTILTGQHPTTHGVWMNGVPAAGRTPPRWPRCCTRPATARPSIGKAHFEPFLDPFGRFTENVLSAPARRPVPPRTTAAGPHRGFEHLEFATHGAMGPLHYARWLRGRAPRGGRRLLPRPRRTRSRSTPRAGATPARPR